MMRLLILNRLANISSKKATLKTVKRSLLSQSYYFYDDWDKYLQNDAIKKTPDGN